MWYLAKRLTICRLRFTFGTFTSIKYCGWIGVKTGGCMLHFQGADLKAQNPPATLLKLQCCHLFCPQLHAKSACYAKPMVLGAKK